MKKLFIVSFILIMIISFSVIVSATEYYEDYPSFPEIYFKLSNTDIVATSKILLTYTTYNGNSVPSILISNVSDSYNWSTYEINGSFYNVLVDGAPTVTGTNFASYRLYQYRNGSWTSVGSVSKPTSSTSASNYATSPLTTITGQNVMNYWQQRGSDRVETPTYPSNLNDTALTKSFQFIGVSDYANNSTHTTRNLLAYKDTSDTLYWLALTKDDGYTYLVLSTVASLSGISDYSMYTVPYNIYYWDSTNSQWTSTLTNVNPATTSSPNHKLRMNFWNLLGNTIVLADTEIEPEETGLTGVLSGVSEIWTGIQNIISWLGNFFSNLSNAIRSVFADIFDFFEDFWDNFTDFLEDIFVPDSEALSQAVQDEVDGLVSQIPIVPQLVTTWRYIFATPQQQNNRKGPETITDKMNDYLFDDKLYNSLQIREESLSMTKSRSGSTNLLSDPSNDLHIQVPVPSLQSSGISREYNEIGNIIDDNISNTNGTREMVIPISLYSREIVNFDIFGYSVKSVRDIVFFFMTIIMWWNFFKHMTRIALGLFQDNPISEWIGAAEDRRNQAEFESQQEAEKAQEERIRQQVRSMDSKEYDDAVKSMKKAQLDDALVKYRMSDKY